MAWKKAQRQPIPGLSIEIGRTGSATYAVLRHTASGLLVASFRGAPIKGVSDLTAQATEHLSAFDWTVPVEQITKEAEIRSEAISRMRPYEARYARSA